MNATHSVLQVRRHRGGMAYHFGKSAEDTVARHYERDGYSVHAQRWRGRIGELDLILTKGDAFVVVEVKASSTHDQARWALGQTQLGRIVRSSEDFLSHIENGSSKEIRVDFATVDHAGTVEVIKNVSLM